MVTPSLQRGDTLTPFAKTLHELNRRYQEAWDRAERLQDELDNIKKSRAFRLLTYWRRFWGAGLTVKRTPIPHFESRTFDDQQLTPTGTVSVLIPFRDRLDLLRNCLR